MSERKRPEFDYSLCVSCGICVQCCGISCITLSEKAVKGDKNLYPTAAEDCIGCGLCAKSCPMGAICFSSKAMRKREIIK